MEKQISGGLKIPHPTFTFPSRQPPLKLKSFSNLHTYHPGLGYLFDVSGDSSIPIQMDNQFRTKTAEHSLQEPKIVHLELENRAAKDDYESRSAYLKVTHLLDPITWIRGKYGIEDSEFPEFFQPSSLPPRAQQKLTDPMNQAYVEAIASYALSKLREADVSPHFHYFYGAYCGIADSYSYNISDVYSTYRHCRWFWENQKKNVFSLEVDSEDMDPEVKEAIFSPPSELHSEVSSEASSVELEEDLEELDGEGPSEQVELQSLHSTAMSSVTFKTQSEETENDSEENDEEDEEFDDESEEINVLAKLQKFPVMLLFTEPSQGTMDDLLTGWEGEGEESTPGEKQWEDIWTAWLFQILSALSVVQTFFGFTHNDLHTNNIVWTQTDQKYFFYQNRDGTVWRIPTYGKVFRLIDFGRSIFWINDKLFFSDDFKEGNDAAEQFYFGPLRTDESQEEIYPNPSFDLCRLAVSLFEALFPMKPETKKGGVILSSEPGLVVQESKSPLYNLLWSWMIDDDGRNVLMEPNGRERYPDFDLYKVITQKVHNAVPKVQILRPIFDRFKVGKQSVGKKNKVYNLFF